MFSFTCILLFIVMCIEAAHCAALGENNGINSFSMAASVDYSKVPVNEKPLYTPPLEEIVDVLSRRLRDNFEDVQVSAEDSPDLTLPPFSLSAPGLTGDAKLVEIGGPPYLLPLVQRDKVYDLAALLRHLRRDPALLAGAGAGPWPYIGVNCEGIINMYASEGRVTQGTRVVTVEPVGAAKGRSGYKQRQLPSNETRTALLGNYLLAEGKPGKVIKVIAKKRIGKSNFITAIREALKEHYGDKVVGLGGTFVLRTGRVRHHVMPDFSAAPVCTDAQVDDWLHFFEMRAPIVHVGTLVTGDLIRSLLLDKLENSPRLRSHLIGLDLRVQHFHGFSAHGDGGHYHYDTTPEEVHYEGYFALASAVIRVDAPPDTHAVGRD